MIQYLLLLKLQLKHKINYGQMINMDGRVKQLLING